MLQNLCVARRIARLAGTILVLLFSTLAGHLPAGTLAPEAVLPDSVGAYQLIRPVRATATDGEGTWPVTEALFNGDGLTSDNPLYAAHGSDAGTVWQHALSDGGLPVSIEFDLGGEFLLNEMWMWQISDGELAGQGIDKFDIVFRDADGNEVGSLENGMDKIKASGIQPTPRFSGFGECVFLPVPDCVRFVELRIRSNLGSDDWVGLAEVAFAGRPKLSDVPEPMTSTILIPAIIAVACRWRRKAGSSRRTRIGKGPVVEGTVRTTEV